MVVKNLKGIKHFLVLLVLLCCQVLQGQSYIVDVRKLSVEDGLSNRFVNKVYKDNRGFIWIATDYGLNRYDGYNFKVYTKENSPLVSNIIKDIHGDDQNRLWIVQESDFYRGEDISILDLKTGSIQSFEKIFNDADLFESADIGGLQSHADNALWLTTDKGTIYRYHSNRFEAVFNLPAEKQVDIIYTDSRFLWLSQYDIITNKRKLLRVDVKDKSVEEIDLKNNSRSLYTSTHQELSLWSFQPLQKKLLWFTGENPDPKYIDLEPFNLPEALFTDTEIIRRFYFDMDNKLLWLYQEKNYITQFLIVHPREGVIADLNPEVQKRCTHGYCQIKTIYFENENKAWIPTADGVFIVTLKKNKFTTLISGESENYSVRGITEDHRGMLYINTLNGRVEINTKTGDLKKYKAGEVLLGVHRDREGNLWFADSYHNIEKYDPISRQSQYYNYEPDIIEDYVGEQWAIVHDTTATVWVGTFRGLYSLDSETGNYQEFNRYNEFPELAENTIYHLREDKEGIWIASSSGLYLLEPGKGITARYSTGEKQPRYIPYDYILHFYRDTTGVFWLATRGGGLIRFDPEDGSYRQFTTAEGLSSNIIYAVYEDDYGKLWLPSNYGLMQFDKNTFQMDTYLKDDGIAHNEFNTISHYQSADGTLYFGGLDGVTVFHPKDFTGENTQPAPLHITSCQVLDGTTGALTDKTKAISDGGRLVLSPSDKSFIVEFALLNYQNTQQNNYSYTIEGLDKTWTTVRDNNLRINALPYGNYTLHIKGQSLKGAQSAGELAIPVVVIKPFYLKTWFVLCSILVLGLLIYGIFQWRLQNLRQAKIKLQQTVKQRTQEIQRQKDEIEKDKNTIEQQAQKLGKLNTTQSRWFTNIAHELRTPLTLILGPIRQFLKAHPETPRTGLQSIQMAEKSSINLLKLVNEILDISRVESNKLKLNKKPTDLNRLIRESVVHFESFATQKGVNLSTKVPENIHLNIDKERIRNILVNLISNALKFTHAGGKVSISLTHEAEDIRVLVTDTGEGIPERDLPHVFERYYQASDPERMNQGGAGIGLALSMELARLHGGDLSVESKPGKGSSFTLHLPQSLATALGETLVQQAPLASPGLLNTKSQSPSNRSENPKNKAHVLLVEDNPDMRQYIRGFMVDLYKVTEAADGLEALEVLKKDSPDLIISDVMMPRMDGFQLLAKIRSAKTTADIAVIMLTARAGREDRLHALTIGVDDYLTKPFDEEELMARIKHSLYNRLKRQQWSVQLPESEKETISADRQFLTRAEEVVIKAISNYNYSVIDMAEDLNLSQRQLFRKIKTVTGLSPLQFIREIRLQKARILLESKAMETVAEVLYAVGFQKKDYFARVYRERFGRLPSSYFI